MTLANTLLPKLAEWRTDSRQNLYATEAGWTVGLTADAADVVGCRLWELRLTRSTALTEDLKARAARVADRVTGLLEPLAVVEVDAPGRVALLRSDAPGQRGDEKFYYEVVLQGDGGSVVRRYRAATPAGQREQVGFGLTHEVIAKLVDDLTA